MLWVDMKKQATVMTGLQAKTGSLLTRIWARATDLYAMQRVGVAAVWLSVIVGSTSACAQVALPPELARAWAQTKLPESSLSVLVQEIGGPQLFAVSPELPRNPASVMKLVTTYAAVSRLGPNYIWHTNLLISADAKASEQGVLSGPLYIRAGGDPIFLLQDLWRLLAMSRLIQAHLMALRTVLITRAPMPLWWALVPYV